MSSHNAHDMIAVDPLTIELLQKARCVARVDSTVLIQGETGTGKDVLAHFIHQNSTRSQKRMVTLNCGAIPKHLVESELFGYEKGAFSGASEKGKIGVLEVGNHSTVFLDEVAELPPDVQTKLLRVLEQKELFHVGGTEPVSVDIRILSATNRDLAGMVREGAFRGDLYYRMNVIQLYIPPLRKRKADIRPLADQFLADINRRYQLQKSFSQAVYAVFEKYEWPGNVRELKNYIERNVIMSDQNEITPQTLSDVWASNIHPSGSPTGQLSLKELMNRYEFFTMAEAINRYGSARAAAAALQVPYSTFVRREKKLREELFGKSNRKKE